MALNNMKKWALSILLVLTFSAYVFDRRVGFGNTKAVPQTPVSTPVSTTQIPVTTSSNKYRDGQYTGRVADAYYGNVQVKATVVNGKITDVQFLQYPNDRRTSIEINTQAMPFLKSEALAAQDSKVDIVSGATQTSEAFRESLASALVQAQS